MTTKRDLLGVAEPLDSAEPFAPFGNEVVVEDVSGPADPVQNDDPFHPSNVAGVQLIVQMRIYDVLLGILANLNEQGEELSNILIETHNNGKIMGPLPWIDTTEE